VGNNPISWADFLGLDGTSISGIIALTSCRLHMDFDLTEPSEHTDLIDKILLQPWGVQYVKNSQQILDAINKKVRKYDPDGFCCRGSCIEHFTLSAHGLGSGRIPLSQSEPTSAPEEAYLAENAHLVNSSSPLGPTSQRLLDQFKKAQSVFQAIKAKMCKNGRISFVICNDGAPPNGEDLKKQLKELFWTGN
jgi:hypothetical protein